MNATPRQIRGSIVILAEWLLRLVALLVPVILEVIRKDHKQRNERPYGEQAQQDDHDVT